MTKEQIIEFNNRLGIRTEYFKENNDILGYYENGVIYLNEYYQDDIEKTNNHEILHMFEKGEKFKIVKEEILNIFSDEERKKIADKYYLKYAGIYSKEEIKNGVLDNEIVIDVIVGNGKFSKEIEQFSKGLFDIIVSDKEIEKNNEKRFLNLSLSQKIEQNFAQLTQWEKLFVLNFYAEEKKGLPNNKQTKYQEVRKDIDKELERLYAFADDENNFKINIENNAELEREFEGEIKALKERGQEKKAITYKNSKPKKMQEMANKISKTLQAEYKHIVDFLKTSEYEPSFKCLMLRETLSKTYKQQKVEGESKTIVQKRDLHKSISGHMTLNETVLRVIYNNLKEYSSFANLYFAGIAIFNKKLTEKSDIKLTNVNTFGMGKWVKFDGKESNEKTYVKNAQELASLVQNTPWCTKQLASSNLADGDFYVFVDNENKPHIAVKMNGNEIDEVRGIKNDNAQELEDEYREVAIELLTKNKDIKHGKEWLEKEEWNKRLIKYIEHIENNDFKEITDNFQKFYDDIFIFEDYRAHGKENSNKEKILELIESGKYKSLQEIFTKKLNCNLEEICFRHYVPEQCNKNIKYALSYVDFEHSQNIDLSNLQKVAGNALFNYSLVTNLSNLKSIGGDAYFEKSKVIDLSSLETIGGDAVFSESEVLHLDKLKCIMGDAFLDCSKVQDLRNLQKIEGKAFFVNSQISDLSSLHTIGRDAFFDDIQVRSLSNLQYVGGDFYLRGSDVQDLSSLKEVKGKVYMDVWQAELFGDMFIKEDDHYRFVPENERTKHNNNKQETCNDFEKEKE